MRGDRSVHIKARSDKRFMPELPEVETICRGLRPAMEGKVLNKVDLYRKNLRYPFSKNFASMLEGVKITSISRRSKYILVEMRSGIHIVIHLGMSGRIKIIEAEVCYKPAKHDHVVFTLEGGRRIIYHDPRRFGFMDIYGGCKTKPSYLSNLGVEPLGNSFNSAYLAGQLNGKSASIKSALLDQRIIAGLGNIYVCEALYISGISPHRRAGDLVAKNGKPKKILEALSGAIICVLRKAIEQGGSTLRDYQKSDGTMGYFQHFFQVYGREGEPCLKPGCAGQVTRQVQNGRSSFYCAKCQK